jgi:streptomycin 6-kinase
VAQRFEQLEPAAASQGGILALSAGAARDLLASQREVAVLHGDIHHGNILDFAERGWLAIDPKGHAGDRAFDYANLFCNPDHRTATSPGRLARRIVVVARSRTGTQASVKTDPGVGRALSGMAFGRWHIA